MHGVNRSVLLTVSDWLAQGESVWYVTVLNTWGASPRPPGSLFAVNRNSGKSVGSLSSGCIEQVLIESWQQTLTKGFPSVKRFGDSSDERSRFMLPCGGTLEVLIELLAPDASTVQHFQSLNEALSLRNPVSRMVDMESGIMTTNDNDAPFPAIQVCDGKLNHRLQVHHRLLILGWGDITQYLLPIVNSLDFDVTICEPRQEVLKRSSSFQKFSADELSLASSASGIPGNVSVTRPQGEDAEPEGLSRQLRLNSSEFSEERVCIRSDVLPDDLIRSEFSDPYCAIVALSHDPRVDDLGLIAALESDAFFIGALGSSRTAERREQRLRELGVSANLLKRIHAPVGLDIGSKTPPEIAVSVAAQLIECAASHLP